MDYVIINSRAYDVLVMGISESFSMLYTDNTGRTIASGAPLTLDCLGTFISHTVTFKRKRGHEAEFDELFDFLSTPRNEGFRVSIAHNQDTLSYTAYCSSGSRELYRIYKEKGLLDWGEMSVTFTPIEAQYPI